MGALTKAEYEARVKRACGNVPDSHPVVAEGMLTSAVNNAPNRLIRENPDLFPEHNNNSWTYGPTAVGDDSAPLPENLIVLERVTVSRDAIPTGTPASDWTLIQEHHVALPVSGVKTIGLIAKPTTTVGYPTFADRKGNFLVFNPTTQTGYTTYFRFYGLAGEEPLAADDDTFRMHEHFDTIIIHLAAAEVLTHMQQYELAGAKESVAERLIAGMRGGVVARERALRPVRMTVAGMPR